MSASRITEEWAGSREDIIQKFLNIIVRKISSNYDLCIDAVGAMTILHENAIREAHLDLRQRCVRVRLLTLVTRDNIGDLRKMTEWAEIRHVSGTFGNFVVADKTDYVGAAEIETNSKSMNLIVCNISSFVKQQQYFFETLWEKAIPIEYRIRELEGRLGSSGRTDVYYGVEKSVSLGVQFMKNVEKEMDIYFDKRAPSIVIEVEAYKNGYIDIKKRGGKIRAFTEITRDNILYCKELMKLVDELRHLDGIKGGLAVSEKEFMATTILEEAKPLAEVIHSTAIEVVQHGQYIFDTFWDRAISANERISELETGIRPRTVEVISDTRNSIGRAFEIMKSVKEQYCVLFASARTFVIAAKAGVAETYKDMARRGAKVRILVPKEAEGDESVAKFLASFQEQLLSPPESVSEVVELRLSEADIKSKISFLVADNKEVITWELKDDTIDDPYQAGGVAIYSNIEALAVSYATIFENLWKITSLTETLRSTNIQLETSQRSMSDFINMAAHELRTPIQPILGLAEVLRSSLAEKTDPTGVRAVGSQQRKPAHEGDSSLYPEQVLIEAIIRNAQRLNTLSDEILDVARIEAGSLKLKKELVDVNAIALKVISDVKASMFRRNSDSQRLTEHPEDDKDVKIVCTCTRAQKDTMMVNADPIRISQVLSNLLTNSLQFTKSGTVSISISSSGTAGTSATNKKNKNSNSGEVAVTVSDTGAGIEPDILPRMFDKFITRSDKGTGLGLYISRGIVEAHGGRIWGMNNEDGRGTSFTFTLPR